MSHCSGIVDNYRTCTPNTVKTITLKCRNETTE